MTITDEELEREFKQNGRPQSTVAQMFSQELMDIFRIENDITDLDEQVDRRKQHINSQTSELEALEARIREMEERLKMQAALGNPAAAAAAAAAAAPAGGSQAPPPGSLAEEEKDHRQPEQQQQQQQLQQHHQQQKYAARSRPGTAKQNQQAVPGGLPPTPAGSEGTQRISP